jgi:hypothetical protein
MRVTDTGFNSLLRSERYTASVPVRAVAHQLSLELESRAHAS